jgi:exosortase/archaeosortase family protein
VAAAVAFLSARPLWQKFIILLSAIPIAISCNVMRVAGQGLLDHYVSQQLSESFAHEFVGLIMLVPAFLLILSVGWVLDQMFVEEAERRHEVVSHIIRRTEMIALAPPPPVKSLAPRVSSPRAARTFSPRGVPPKMNAGSSGASNSAPAAGPHGASNGASAGDLAANSDQERL